MAKIFNVEKAKQAGFSDEEIQKFLNENKSIQSSLDIAQEATIPPEVQEQRSIVSELEQTQIDPSVLNIQKQRLSLLEEGVPEAEMPFSLRKAPFETAGQNITEDVTKSLISTRLGREYPGLVRALAISLGTITQLAPDIITSIPPIRGAKVVGTAIENIPKAFKATKFSAAFRSTGTKEVLKLEKQLITQQADKSIRESALKLSKSKVGELAVQRKQQLVQEGQEVVGQAQEAFKKLPQYQKEIISFADETVLKAKAAISEAEDFIGVGLKDVGLKQFNKLIDTPDKIKDFAIKYFDIVNKVPAEQLGKALTPVNIQTIRKAAENAVKQSGSEVVRTELFAIQSHFRNALNFANKAIKTANTRFKQAIQAKNSLPGQFKETKSLLDLGLKRVQNMAKQNILNDTQLKSLNRTIKILERKQIEIPAQFTRQKEAIDIAIKEAKDLAARQATIRKWAGGAAIGAAAGGIFFSLGQKLVGR